MTDQTPDTRIIWPEEHRPELAKVFTKNVIELDGTPEQVWSHLIDCVAWPTYYPHCSDVSILTDDSVLGPTSQFQFKTLEFFDPKITTFVVNRMLVWQATGPLGTSGSHAWYIEGTGSGCRVITEEAHVGWLLWLVGSRTQRQLSSCHQDWLKGLKKRIEGRCDVPTLMSYAYAVSGCSARFSVFVTGSARQQSIDKLFTQVFDKYGSLYVTIILGLYTVL